MIYLQTMEGYHSPVDGVTQKTLVYGEKTLMVEFRLCQGSHIPLHGHPHEQTGYLVSGSLRLTVGSETRQCRAGDAWNIPSDVDHFADALEDCVAIEVFSPRREDYMS